MSDERMFTDGQNNQHIQLAKAELRRRFIGIRRDLSPRERQVLSQQICEQVKGWLRSEQRGGRLPRTGTVGLYAAMWDEADLTEFATAIRAVDWKTVYPKADVENRTLTFHFVRNEAELTAGAYGIREPSGEAPVAAAAELDLVLVPGVAFTDTGVRLGYGGGFYDRLLPRLSATVMGIAFSCQQTGALPADALDQPVHAIATEAEVIRCNPQLSS